LPAATILVAMASVYLQAEGNRLSGQDANNLMNAVLEQTYTLKSIKDEHGIADKSDTPSEKKTNTKSAAVKNPSERRKQVNDKKREHLRLRRQQFGGSRSH
jgi:hypothetical protein